MISAGVSSWSRAAEVEQCEGALLSLGSQVTTHWLVLVQAACAHVDHRVHCLPQEWVTLTS